MLPMRGFPGECAAHSIWRRLSTNRDITMLSRSYLFFEVLRSLDLITNVEPLFSQVTPKLLYENEHATAFWDVPLFADTT